MKYTGKGSLAFGGDLVASGDEIPKKLIAIHKDAIEKLKKRGVIDGDMPGIKEAKEKAELDAKVKENQKKSGARPDGEPEKRGIIDRITGG